MSEEKKPMGAAQQVEETVYAQPGLRRNAALWSGLLGPPLAWLALLGVSYAFVANSCDGLSRGLLVGLGALTLLACVAAGLVAWRMYVAPGEAPDDREARVAGRERFMALGGLLSSTLFALLVLAMSLPIAFLRPCD